MKNLIMEGLVMGIFMGVGFNLADILQKILATVTHIACLQ